MKRSSGLGRASKPLTVRALSYLAVPALLVACGTQSTPTGSSSQAPAPPASGDVPLGEVTPSGYFPAGEFYGWADPVETPVRVVEYYLDIVDTLGEDTLEFSRLFMAPGVHHCGGGAGPNNFDMLAPLENWVERGVAPDRIIAAHMTGTTVDRTRPLCAYPQEAKYIGSGSIDDAANFVCRQSLDGDYRK